MKYVNQLEYPYVVYQTNTDDPTDEKRKQGTFKMSGCGLASAIMVADRLLVKPDFDIFESVELSYECGGNHAIGTDYAVFAPAFAEKMGLDLEFTNDPERVRYCLRTGGCAVALSTGDWKDHVGLFTHGGHFITIISELRDGRVAVLDPSQTPVKYDEEGRVGKVEVDGNLIYTDLQNIVDDFSQEKRDANGKSPETIFSLFWRKDH